MINSKLLHMFKLEREMTRYLHAIWDNLQQGHVLFSMYSQFEYLCVRDELQELYLELNNEEFEELYLMTYIVREFPFYLDYEE